VISCTDLLKAPHENCHADRAIKLVCEGQTGGEDLKPAKLPHWSRGRETVKVGRPVSESRDAYGMTRRMGRRSRGNCPVRKAAAAVSADSCSAFILVSNCSAGFNTDLASIWRRCHKSKTCR